MEKINPEPKPDFNDQFDKLPFEEFMELPMSMLSPITIDDYKDPATEGPLDVFRKGNKIFIDDGNHRFFKNQRDLYIKNGCKDPNYSEVMMKIRKVNPEKAINSWMLKY